MTTQFDEFTKSMTRSVTRRGAVKKFGLGLAGLALACFGLTNKANAQGKCGDCIDRCMENNPNWGIDRCLSKCIHSGHCVFGP